MSKKSINLSYLQLVDFRKGNEQMKKRLLILFSLLLFCSGCMSKNNNQPENNPTTTELVIDEYKIVELLKNNYLYASFALGLITGDESQLTKIVDSDYLYYLILDDKIKNLDSFANLVNEVFVPDRFSDYFNLLHEKKEFVQVDDDLYGYNKEVACDIGNNYDFSDFEILNKNSDRFTLSFNGTSVEVYVINNEYRLKENIFRCK